MKKLLLSIFGTGLILVGGVVAQENMSGNMEGMDTGMVGNQEMMMSNGMMGMMMNEPEIKIMMMEHMKKCRQEIMQKMMSNPKVVEKMMKMMLMHKESVKKVINNNPQIKKELKELTK
jgi:predicted histidine transporter YuiF (NhaC family)